MTTDAEVLIYPSEKQKDLSVHYDPIGKKASRECTVCGGSWECVSTHAQVQRDRYRRGMILFTG